jgi:hypothetical protein
MSKVGNNKAETSTKASHNTPHETFDVFESPILEANQAVHSCAKFVSLQERSFSWVAEPPAFLVHSLEADCNPLFSD